MTEYQHEFLKFWRENDKEIAHIQSMCDELRKELRAREKAQTHIDQCREELENLNPSYVGVFKSWIYAGHVAVFDLADRGYIDRCGVFLNVEFYPHKVSQVLHDDNSPFEQETLAKAVENTVKILKVLADLKLGASGNAAPM